MIVTVSLVIQLPLVMVHTKVKLPVFNPVIPVIAEEGVVIVAEEVVVHRPVAGAGLLPVRVAEVALHKVWSTPALATTGAATVSCTVSREIQEPLVIVHTKLYTPALLNPVIVVEGLDGEVMVPPFNAVH